MSAGVCAARCKESDLAGRRIGWLIWGLPAGLLIVGIAWSAARPWLWIPSLVLAGAACLANASRCGRLHCFMTGPLFLLGALATLFDAIGMVAIDWRWILAAVVAGTVAAYGLEWTRGRYVGAEPTRERTDR